MLDNVSSRWHLACFGNQSHYQHETGICFHVEKIVKRLGKWHRARVRYLPFGRIGEVERSIP